MGHLLGLITPLLFKCLMDIMSQQVKLHGSVDFLFPSVPKSIQTSFESPFYLLSRRRNQQTLFTWFCVLLKT